MRPLDLAVILAYFALTVAVGLRGGRGTTTAGDYFLGARDLAAWPVLLSIVATETSALTVISVPGIGATGNLAFLQLAFGYLAGRIAVARWLLPGYFEGEQDTAYARLERRFGPGTRRTASVVFLATRFLGDSVRIFAGAIPLAVLTGWPVPLAIAAMGLVTLGYTTLGGLKAVIWTDVLQLTVYVFGGVAALVVATGLAGGAGAMLARAGEAGRLVMLDLRVDLTVPYTLLGGLVGGALLSAASHGTDHLVVQRLLATRSLRDARVALVGSGIVVIGQFLLFLLAGTAIWAAGLAPAGTRGDEVFPRFVIAQLPPGLSGLVIAGVLAAAMSTVSSSINALASSLTHDLYASLTGRRDPAHLLRVGRRVSVLWGVLLVGGALAFHLVGRRDTPVVVLALSIASVTYGGLLGSYLLAGAVPAARGRDAVTGLATGVAAMLVVLFAGPLAALPGLGFLAPFARLAWPWYVALGTLLTFVVGLASSRLGTRSAP